MGRKSKKKKRERERERCVYMKFSKPGFNSTWTENLQMFKMHLEKAEERDIKLPTSAGSLKKQESSRKTSISALLTMPKPLTVWITTNCGKFLKRWEYQTTLPASWETCMHVRKQQLEPDMEQWIDSTLGKEYDKVVYYHPAYFNLYAEWSEVKLLSCVQLCNAMDCSLPGSSVHGIFQARVLEWIAIYLDSFKGCSVV